MEIPRGGGWQKQTFLKKSMECPKGVGERGQTQNPSVGGLDIFWNHTLQESCCTLFIGSPPNFPTLNCADYMGECVLQHGRNALSVYQEKLI